MVCCLSGCGTYASVNRCDLGWKRTGENWIYGGVQMDVTALREIPGEKDISLPLKPVLMTWAVADMPFSAAADTLFLPFTIHATLTRLGRDPEQQGDPMFYTP
jgi:uncharacterized protein YceK